MQRQESDQELMLKVREDDGAAFAELMRRYQDRLIGFFFSIGRDNGLAEDLFQETFIRVWNARKRYQPAAKFSTYLIGIARNLWLNERPRWKRRLEMESLEDAMDEDHPDALSVAAADLGDLPEEVLLRRERERSLREALDALPPQLMLVFVLSHFEGYKYREIAGMLSIPEGTVKWRMSEATRRLRGKLADLWEKG